VSNDPGESELNSNKRKTIDKIHHISRCTRKDKGNLFQDPVLVNHFFFTSDDEVKKKHNGIGNSPWENPYAFPGHGYFFC
jgi:hypothetical protein